MKKFILFLVFVLFLINIVAAQELVVKSEPVKGLLVLPGGKAIFNLEVYNYQGMADKFEVVYPSIEWIFSASPSYVSLSSGDKKTIEVTLEPKLNIGAGVYDVPLVIYSSSNADIRNDFTVRVKVIAPEDLISISINTLPTGLDPKKESLVQVKFKNRNDIELKNIKVSLESELFKKEDKFDFDPYEEKTMDFTVKLPVGTREGMYDVRTTILWDDNIVYDKIRNVKVGYYSDIKESKSFRKSFLKSINILERYNNGNAVIDEEYNVRLSRFEKLFTEFKPKPTSVVKVNGEYDVQWLFKLEPQESYTIQVVTSYRLPLILLIILLFIIYVAYTLLKGGISIKKRILTIKSKEGIADMKVLLIINNKGKNITDVKIIDQIPHAINVTSPISYGTLKPSKIRKGTHGLVLVWEIPTLLKEEERILSYRVTSDVQGVGRLIIPRAALKYRGKRKQYVTILSNRTSLFS